MPLHPIDYSKVVFYKIVSNDLDIRECYVGSSTNFTKRKYQHKMSCTNPRDHNYNYKLYQFIREHGGWENFSIVPLEEVSCSGKLEVLRKEREHFENESATLNMSVPSRTKSEWSSENKERASTTKKEWYQNNLEMTKERSKTRYFNNKEKIQEYKSQLVECPNCSIVCCRASLCKHRKSQKCLNHVKQQDNED